MVYIGARADLVPVGYLCFAKIQVTFVGRYVLYFVKESCIFLLVIWFTQRFGTCTLSLFMPRFPVLAYTKPVCRYIDSACEFQFCSGGKIIILFSTLFLLQIQYYTSYRIASNSTRILPPANMNSLSRKDFL